MRRNTRITKKREGGERGGGGLSESRAQSSFAKLKSKRHSSLDCRKLLLIKLHSTYSPAAPTKYVFATVYSTHHDEHLIKRTQTPETSETLDSTIRILIGALRFERRKTSTRKCSQKRILEKIGAPMTNTTTEKLGAKRSLTYQRLHLSIP